MLDLPTGLKSNTKPKVTGEMLKSSFSMFAEIGLIEPKSTIYHEMGHLQDFLLNLKETQDYDNRYDTKTLHLRLL